MDAASRTGIDDVRELIEGVRYRPVSARYKVYIIDEVHMLSEKAFNALLKTLEEPPPHVKFVFATTEIRKVPVTVLSRCQRFDLKRVPQETLVDALRQDRRAEKVEISPEALALLARAADGSVRDGLSMLDQAIAHGGGVVDAAQVRDMLGLADRSRVLELFEKTMRGDAPGGRGGAGRDARCRRRSGRDPAGPARAHALGDAAEGRARGRRAPRPTASARRASAMAGKLSMASLTRAWTLLMKGLQETLLRALAAARGRDGADPPVLRRRPALALRCPQGACRTAADAGGTVAARAAPAPRGGGGGGGAAARSRPQPASRHRRSQPAPRRRAQSQELHRDRGAVRGPARGAAGQLA